MKDLLNNRTRLRALLAAVLLVAAAAAAAMIPWRLQRLLDVGVRCGGVEYATPLRLRTTTMDNLMLLLPEKTAKEAARAYDLVDGVYLLHGTADAKRLSDAFALPVLQYKRLSEQGVNTFAAINAALEHGAITREDVIERANSAVEAMGELTPQARVEAAASFIRTEYAVAGGDASALRERMISSELGRIVLLSAAALLAGALGHMLSADSGKALRRLFPAALAVGSAVFGLLYGGSAGLILAGEVLVLLAALFLLRPRGRRAVAFAACAAALAALTLVEATPMLELAHTPGRLVALLIWAMLAAAPALSARGGKEAQA